MEYCKILPPTLYFPYTTMKEVFKCYNLKPRNWQNKEYLQMLQSKVQNSTLMESPRRSIYPSPDHTDDCGMLWAPISMGLSEHEKLWHKN
jgi:hypothetical protein